MSNDVIAVTLSTTGSVYSARCRVRQIIMSCGSTGGSLVLRDGGATGTVLLDVDTPANAGFVEFCLAGRGILFEESVHATLNDVDSLTVVLEG